MARVPRWFVALGAIPLAGCGPNTNSPCNADYQPPEECPAPVVICEPCWIEGKPLVLDISKVDLSKTPQAQASQTGGTQSAADAKIDIDGIVGKPMAAPDHTSFLFFFSHLPARAERLTYTSARLEASSGEELILHFLDVPCALADHEFTACPE